MAFAPHTTDRWRELCFPFRDIGGLTEVSPTAAMHVAEADGQLTIGVRALRPIADTLVAQQGGRTLYQTKLGLSPMESWDTSQTRQPTLSEPWPGTVASGVLGISCSTTTTVITLSP